MGKQDSQKPERERAPSTDVKAESWIAAVESSYGPPGKHRHLCLVLWRRMSDAGEGKASQPEIAEWMGKGRGTINVQLQELEDLGWLRRPKGVERGQGWALRGFQATVPNHVLYGVAGPGGQRTRSARGRVSRQRTRRPEELELRIVDDDQDEEDPRDPPPGGRPTSPLHRSGEQHQPAHGAGEQTRPRSSEGGRVFQQPSPNGSPDSGQPRPEGSPVFGQPFSQGGPSFGPPQQGSRFFWYELLEFLQQLPHYLAQFTAAAATAAAVVRAHEAAGSSSSGSSRDATHQAGEGAPHVGDLGGDLLLSDVLLRLPADLRASVVAHLRPAPPPEPPALELPLDGAGVPKPGPPPSAGGPETGLSPGDPDVDEIEEMRLGAEAVAGGFRVVVQGQNSTLQPVAAGGEAARDEDRVLSILRPLWTGKRRAAWTLDNGSQIPWGTGDRPRLWEALIGVLRLEGGNPYKILRYVLLREENNRVSDPQPGRGPAAAPVRGTEHARHEQAYRSTGSAEVKTQLENPGRDQRVRGASQSWQTVPEVAQAQLVDQWKRDHPAEASALREQIARKVTTELDGVPISDNGRDITIRSRERKEILRIIAEQPTAGASAT